jgi:ATP-binding cassette subfamily B (MDR/TAP) protein 9
VWILASVGIALLQSRHSSEDVPVWMKTAAAVSSESFGYVVCLLLSAPCIVQLLGEKPQPVSDEDSDYFWVATVVGLICSAGEACFTIEAIPGICERARKRRERVIARRQADHQASGVSLLGVDSPQTEETSVPSDVASSSDAIEAKKEGEKPKRPTVKKLVRLVAFEWRLLIQAAIFLLLAAVMEALIPHYISEICSAIIKGEEKGTLAQRPYIQPVLCLALVGFGCGLFSSCRGATFIWIGSKVSARLRQDLFRKLASSEIGFFDTTKTGELTSRMTQDCQKVTDQVTLNINVFLRTAVTMITTLFFMFLVSVPMTCVAFISVPVVAVVSKKYGKFMQKLSEQTQKALADANAVAEEGLSTMSTVRMFAAEKLEEGRFAAKLITFVKLQQRQARFYILYLTLTISLPNFATALVLCFGGKLAMHGELESSRLLAFVFYLQTLNSAFGTLGDFYSNIVQALGAATRVFELLERKVELPLEPSADIAISDHANRRGELKFIDVHFTYPARPDVKVLKGLNLEVPAGQTVALVGPSGNGKSTVISLLKRLYKASEGQVLLDGTDVWSFSHKAFHRCISIVGQEPVLYARTIRQNITYGIDNPPPSDQDVPGCSICNFAAPRLADGLEEGEAVSDTDVEEAARTANAYTFITDMPKGFDTEVGERGVQLSGGQKQRIAIARALVRHPRVLLLDEATSALDAESERQVQQAIDSMIVQGQMTVVIIAHRLSTVKNSHKICVVQGGEVVEQGPHEQLVEQRGAYFNLIQSQLSGLIPSTSTVESSDDKCMAQEKMEAYMGDKAVKAVASEKAKVPKGDKKGRCRSPSLRRSSKDESISETASEAPSAD